MPIGLYFLYWGRWWRVQLLSLCSDLPSPSPHRARMRPPLASLSRPHPPASISHACSCAGQRVRASPPSSTRSISNTKGAGGSARQRPTDRRGGTSGNKGGGFRSLFLHIVPSRCFSLADRCRSADAGDLVIASHLSSLTPISIPRRCVRVYREAAVCERCANAAAAAPKRC